MIFMSTLCHFLRVNGVVFPHAKLMQELPRLIEAPVLCEVGIDATRLYPVLACHDSSVLPVDVGVIPTSKLDLAILNYFLAFWKRLDSVFDIFRRTNLHSPIPGRTNLFKNVLHCYNPS